MTYDHNGLRTGKTVTRDGETTRHVFYYQGGRLVAERRYLPDGGVVRLEFVYDEAGRPLQVIHTAATGQIAVFNYVLNLQGDVQHVRNAASGNIVAWYVYNAWGYPIAMGRDFAEINPLRYRGYYWDSALGMYYLNSRFYDPYIGRFINADAFLSTGQGLLGFNAFVYCLNNPVMMIDPTGLAGICIRAASTPQGWAAINLIVIGTGGAGNTTGWRPPPGAPRTAAQARSMASQGIRPTPHRGCWLFTVSAERESFVMSRPPGYEPAAWAQQSHNFLFPSDMATIQSRLATGGALIAGATGHPLLAAGIVAAGSHAAGDTPMISMARGGGYYAIGLIGSATGTAAERIPVVGPVIGPYIGRGVTYVGRWLYGLLF